jgi:hypothetical protein
MENLNGHEAGNGGYGQGVPNVTRHSLTLPIYNVVMGLGDRLSC